MALGSELPVVRSIQASEGHQWSGKAQTVFMAGSQVTKNLNPRFKTRERSPKL